MLDKRRMKGGVVEPWTQQTHSTKEARDADPEERRRLTHLSPHCVADIEQAMLSIDLREVRRGGLPLGMEELHGTTLPGKTLVQVLHPCACLLAVRSTWRREKS